MAALTTIAPLTEGITIDHLLQNPEKYIGSMEEKKEKLWVWDKKMVKRDIRYVPGLYNIVDKILMNFADNKKRDPVMKLLWVTFKKKTIMVEHDGSGVPVVPDGDDYLPAKMFGKHLNRSDYDGYNSLGAKLANIFSTEFNLYIIDPKQKLTYEQDFTNNMKEIQQPKVTETKSVTSWTKITFHPDLGIFGEESYDDFVLLMKRRVVDLACTLGVGVDVRINGKCVKSNTLERYVNLYLPSTQERIYEQVNDYWEVCVTTTTDKEFEQVSFLNHTPTIKGGAHVDHVTNEISHHLKCVLTKDMAEPEKDKEPPNLEAGAIKNFLWIFVKVIIDKPTFDSQGMPILSIIKNHSGSTCELTQDFLFRVTDSDIVKNLRIHFELDGIDKHHSAKFAGTTDSERCTLILTEGDSAVSLAMQIINDMGTVGRDYYGVFPLQGKLTNVRDLDPTKWENNVVIKSLLKILGLDPRQKENIQSRYYGRVMIMADQDPDGSHIKGLILNFFHYLWPSLLKVDKFLQVVFTPIYMATSKKDAGDFKCFYTKDSYEKWRDSTKNEDYTIKYFKGLASFSKKDASYVVANFERHTKYFRWSGEEDDELIEFAFSNKRTAERYRSQSLVLKEGNQPIKAVTYYDSFEDKYISIKEFVVELQAFWVVDCQRSIPSMVDGLKPVQRKILYTAFDKNINEDINVEEFSGIVSEHTDYHHGRSSIDGSIIRLSQDFVGSNNINLLKPSAQFGSRLNAGKDHGHARYLYTKPTPIARVLFNKDDDPLLNFLDGDGKRRIEPKWYIPIIPLIVVNGVKGIGTGVSTEVLKHKLLDVIDYIETHLLDSKEESNKKKIKPWFKGFKGNFEPSRVANTFMCHGVIRIDEAENSVSITEVPITTPMKGYIKFLTKARDQEKPLIEGFNRTVDHTSFCFKATMTADQMAKAKSANLEGLRKMFHLTSKITLDNMHLFDGEGNLKKYDSIETIIDQFIDIRLKYYEGRRVSLISKFDKGVQKLQNELRYLDMVIHKNFRFSTYPESFNKDMVLHEFKKFPEGINADEDESYEYLRRMPDSNYKPDYLVKLGTKCETMKTAKAELENITASQMWLKDLAELRKDL